MNDDKFLLRSEIIRDKGTNRAQFNKGGVDKYTWQDIGSSFLPGEITAAFLFAQLEQSREITAERLSIWHRYHEAFSNLDFAWLKLPFIPDDVLTNGHIYFLRLSNLHNRDEFIKKMAEMQINCVFHYVPLHNSLAGKKYGRCFSSLIVTEESSDTLVRLPLWIGLSKKTQRRVIDSAIKVLKDINSKSNQ